MNMKQVGMETDSIVKKRKLQVGAKEIDLEERLNREGKISKEYRAQNIQELSLPDEKGTFCKISIIFKDSLSAARNKNGKVAVLNFASSKHPGGGFFTINKQEFSHPL